MTHRMLQSTVFIKGIMGTGSGTIIFSQPVTNGAERKGKPRARTFVLTNWHVVDENVLFRFSKKYGQSGSKRPMTARERWEVTRIPLMVSVFDFKPEIVDLKYMEYKADIVACDKSQDLALLRLRSGRVFPSVAQFAPRDFKCTWANSEAWAVGCPAGSHPFHSDGEIKGINEARIFSTTQIHFGSSGGGLYRLADGHYELIGVTTTVESETVAGGVISHMAYSIPIKVVCEFLEKNNFGFITKQLHETAAE